ncbi:MAG: hypothetical protein JXR10_02800 [Cyclobacteriaceae bacterium]
MFILGGCLTASASVNDEKPSDIKSELAHEPNREIAQEPAIGGAEEGPKGEIQKDTAETNSVSKFNFVFYYIYKMKYSEDALGNEQLEYGF